MSIDEKTAVSATTLATVLGLTRRRIDQLADEGVLVKTDAKFLLAESVQAYLSARLDQDRLPDEEAEAERLRILTARRQLLEHEVKTIAERANDPREVMIPMFQAIGKHMRRIWTDISNVWPVHLAQTHEERVALQAWCQDRLRTIWQEFVDDLEDAAPEPHRTAFRVERERAEA